MTRRTTVQIKCDRCCCTIPSKMDEHGETRFISNMSYVLNVAKRGSIKTHVKQELDFCKSCTDDFLKWKSLDD